MVIKPPKNLTNLFDQFNDFSSDQKQNSDYIRKCKYPGIDEVQTLNKLNKRSLSLFHVNVCFLYKNHRRP